MADPMRTLFWTVTAQATSSQDTFSGSGYSLKSAVENLRMNMRRDAELNARARADIHQELDDV